VQTLQSRLGTAAEPTAQDALTRLHSRKALDEQLERLADLGVLLERPVHLLIVDVDQMRSVNEAYGTATGDEVLRQLGKCLLRQFFRREDFVARCGGDEFALLSYDGSARAAEAVAQRLLGSIRQLEMRAIGRTVHVTVSIGVASQIAGESAAVWLERAYRAAFLCRRRGGDGVLVAQADAA
jgi:diguanylate cyclase (GGDEF)-like protein